MNFLLLHPDELRADGRAVLRDRRADHVRTVLRAEAGQTLRAGVVGGGLGTAVVLAVDGEIHATQHDRDAEREALLNAAGYRVVRFTNHELLADLPRVLTIIQRAAEALPQRTADPIARTHGW